MIDSANLLLSLHGKLKRDTFYFKALKYIYIKFLYLSHK